MTRLRRLAAVAALAGAVCVAACSNESPSRVPVAEGQSGAAGPALPPGGIYTAQRGDTLYSIARRFNVTVRAIIDANHLEPPFMVQPGQQLQLPQGGAYVVVKGDTLSKIARKTGVAFDALARLNNLAPPYLLKVGQRLALPTGAAENAGAANADEEGGGTMVITSPAVSGAAPPPPAAEPNATVRVEALPMPTPPPKETVTFGDTSHTGSAPQGTTSTYQPLATREVGPNPAQPAAPTQPAPLPAATAPASTAAPPAQIATTAPEAPPAPAASGFIWPVRGQVLEPFGSSAKGQHNDGINISVAKGTPILAAADGDVAYAGNELRGFGNLILIKHAGGWVTAYAHNDRLLVHRGDHVKRGQKIALAGDSGGVSQPQLHFELRQGVKPVDPMTMLPAELSPAAFPAGQPSPG